MNPQVKAGLEQIMASEDINEIKTIAQSLLGMAGEGEGETEVEVEVKKPSLNEKLAKAVGSDMGGVE